MSTWDIIQASADVLFILALFVFWVRIKRPPQDDPRLSRGLQLLQSKISVLEDLSDRTELQVKQLNGLMEKRALQVQAKVEEADKIIKDIEASMSKSMEVAEIFQDKIPHEEIIKRKDTIKYIKAAQLAHAGVSIEDIRKEVQLPESEIEMIIKVNKDQLMFDNDSLPEWAKTQLAKGDGEEEGQSIIEGSEAEEFEFLESPKPEQNFSDAFQTPNTDLSNLQKLGEEFRQACTEYDDKLQRDHSHVDSINSAPSQIVEAAKSISSKVADEAMDFGKSALESAAEASKLAADQAVQVSKAAAEQAAKASKVAADQAVKVSRAAADQAVQVSKVAVDQAAQQISKATTKPANQSLEIESVEGWEGTAREEAKTLTPKTQDPNPGMQNLRNNLSQSQQSFKLDKEPKKKVIKKVMFPRIGIDKKDLIER